jgi:hypothetical protein
MVVAWATKNIKRTNAAINMPRRASIAVDVLFRLGVSCLNDGSAGVGVCHEGRD